MANPASGMPTHASFLYARNVANVLGLLAPGDSSDDSLSPDWDDEIVRGICVLREGKPAQTAVADLLGVPAPAEPPPAAAEPPGGAESTASPAQPADTAAGAPDAGTQPKSSATQPTDESAEHR
jgi:hypothetical protein